MEMHPPIDQVRHYSLRATTLLIGATISDSVILVVMALAEYILRWTSLVPFSRRPFPCPRSSATNNSSLWGRRHPWPEWTAEPLVVILSLSLPVMLMLVVELLVWLGLGSRKPDIHLRCCCCPRVTLFQAVRRLYRFFVTYLFGVFATMIVVDVIKNAVGQPRPKFLADCNPNCKGLNHMLTIADCSNKDNATLRDISTSFPSMHSALPMYAAVTVMIYLRGVSKLHHSKYLIMPFVCLLFLVAATCCGLLRLGLNQNHWPDVLVGQLIGAFIAAYLGLVLLRSYELQMHISNRKLMDQILALEARLMLLNPKTSESRVPRASMEMRAFTRTECTRSERKVKQTQQRVDFVNPSPVAQQAPFNEHSNTFREDLRKTLNAMSTRPREPEIEEDDVFYP